MNITLAKKLKNKIKNIVQVKYNSYNKNLFYINKYLHKKQKTSIGCNNFKLLAAAYIKILLVIYKF